MNYLEILENLIKMDVDEGFNYILEITNKLIVKKYEFNDHKSIIISNKKDNDFDICFLTHIDVVPAKTYEMIIDGNIIKGRGTIDMKGAIAVILDVLINNDSKNNIGLIITSDEEQGGFNGVKKLVELIDMKFAIVPDGGRDFNLVIEEKGVLNLNLVQKGKSAHSSQSWNGENAITLLINKLQIILDEFPNPVNDQDYVTSVNPSIIRGGSVLNKIPDYAECEVNIRRTSDISIEYIINFIKNLGLEVSIISEGELYKTDLEDNIVKKYIKIVEENINRKVKYVKCESASDARFLKCPSVIMNPTGDNPHCDNEYVTIDGLETLKNIYIDIIKDK